MATTFNDSLTMLADLPVGTKFKRPKFKAVYSKVSPWHVRRADIRNGKVFRIPTNSMVYAETPSWSR